MIHLPLACTGIVNKNPLIAGFRSLIQRGELVGGAVIAIIGLAPIVLAPARSVERVSAVVV
jgi:hypothetical protein